MVHSSSISTHKGEKQTLFYGADKSSGKFTQEQSFKTQRESRCIDPFFLQLRGFIGMGV
jgi:hypothetical protein